MIYSAEEQNRGSLLDALNGSNDRCVLAQGEVSPHLIVISSVRVEDAAQVRLAEHHDVVRAVVRKNILPRLGTRGILTDFREAKTEGPYGARMRG